MRNIGVFILNIGFTLFMINVSYAAYFSKQYFSALDEEINKTTMLWIKDVKRLSKIEVEIDDNDLDILKNTYRGEIDKYFKNKEKAINLGKKGLTNETIKQIQATGFYKTLNISEKEFWINQAINNSIFLTSETIRNIYYAILLSVIKYNPPNPKLKLPIKKFIHYFRCDNPPYTKWYCH